MRILLEGWRLAQTSDIGGVESYWKQLVPALLEEAGTNDRFTILSAFLSPRKSKFIQPFAKNGAHIRHWWSNPAWLQALGRGGVPAEWLAGQHDLVHACEPDWDIHGSAPLVVTCHDLMYHHFPQFISPECAARLERGTQKAAARSAYWLCNSEHTRQDLITTFGVAPARTAVTPLGVGDGFFAAEEAEEEQEPYFIFVGSVEPKKNLPMLIEAFAQAKQAGLEARLKIAGRASWQSGVLTATIRRNPVMEEHVDFLGFVDFDELPQLMARSRGLVLPSRYEGFGMPVVEAMAAGCPVLCTRRGALADTAGDAAVFFDPDDVDGLAELLLSIDSDRGRRDNMRQRGQLHAKDFTWQRCARLTLDGYRRACELRT